MIGIYQDNFLDYLKSHLGHVKVSSKNIIIPCPWCEYNLSKNHYHLYISLEAPIFHCFHAGCEQKGILRKLIRKLEGHDISDKFVDNTQISGKKRKIKIDEESSRNIIKIPDINSKSFKDKEFYIRKRIKFTNIRLEQIKGLVFDINAFIEDNKIPVDEKLFRIRDFLQANFVGFLTENKSTLIMRNIDEKSSFRHFKMKIFDTPFLDYYKIQCNPNSNTVVLTEGIFNILTEQIFDTIKMKDNIRLYASAHSYSYQSLLRSIVFNEQIFRLDVIILSDQGIDINNYRKMKKYNSHIIDKMTVFYNLTGKDFNENFVSVNKFVI